MVPGMGQLKFRPEALNPKKYACVFSALRFEVCIFMGFTARRTIWDQCQGFTVLRSCEKPKNYTKLVMRPAPKLEP